MRTSITQRHCAYRELVAVAFAIFLVAPAPGYATETDYYRRPATILDFEPERDCIRVRLAAEHDRRDAKPTDVSLYLVKVANIRYITPAGQTKRASSRDLIVGTRIFVTGYLNTVTEIRIPKQSK
jgi:hypothetical protein